jgi:hypothetical protein
MMLVLVIKVTIFRKIVLYFTWSYGLNIVTTITSIFIASTAAAVIIETN